MSRQLYGVVAWSDGTYNNFLYVPLPAVIGPFKTKTQARKAGEEDFGGKDGVFWRVTPLIPFSTKKDELVTLTYERLYDSALERRRRKVSDG